MVSNTLPGSQALVCVPVAAPRDPPAEMLEQLTLDGVRGVLEAQLHPTNLELNVAGDFGTEELEQLVLRYLGELGVAH